MRKSAPSYLQMTLEQLAAYFGPNDLINVQRVQIEKRAAQNAINNISAKNVAEKTVDFAVESFDSGEE